ncbi:surface lipoprotein assembly modifier [candidate division KSB1 bacterium]|nr:surface lipoprotein assembly modifier [candidate division KSB1 bacterium]
MKRIIILALLSSLLNFKTAWAQFSFDARVMTMYDDNVNNNHLSLSDKVALLSLQVAQEWENETRNTQLFYTGAYSYFDQVRERAFHYHSIGLAYSQLFGEERQTQLNSGITYNLRRNRESYTFYDHQQVSAYVNLKHYLAERSLGRFSYSFRYLSFDELSDFNYVEHYGFAQLTQSFTTKTTLILEADLGTKIYTSANLEETATMSRGRGHGGRIVTASKPKVTQLVGIARLGQGIVAGTGLSLTAQYQLNLQKDSRYLSSGYGVISDDELFDDHYGYEGPQVSVMLTQLLPAGMVMKISGNMQERNYTERPAYDLTGNQSADERADTRRAFSMQLEKTFKSLGFSIGLAYDHIRNNSNDLFYDYANNALTAQLSLGR